MTLLFFCISAGNVFKFLGTKNVLKPRAYNSAVIVQVLKSGGTTKKIKIDDQKQVNKISKKNFKVQGGFVDVYILVTT